MIKASPLSLAALTILVAGTCTAAIPSERWLGPCVSGSGAAGSQRHWKPSIDSASPTVPMVRETW